MDFISSDDESHLYIFESEEKHGCVLVWYIKKFQGIGKVHFHWQNKTYEGEIEINIP